MLTKLFLIDPPTSTPPHPTPQYKVSVQIKKKSNAKQKGTYGLIKYGPIIFIF